MPSTRRRSSTRRALARVAGAALGAAVVAGIAPTAAVAAPAVPGGLPSAIEPTPAYVGQVSCDPAGKPGAVALGRLITAAYPGTTYGIDRACGAGGSVSEHYEGRAVDWMVRADVPQQKAQAEDFLRWLLGPDAAGNPQAMARRLGVMYVIWDKQWFSVYRPSDGWKPYACSDVTSCHSDHVHLSLTWDGAHQRTSFWTGRVAGGTDHGPCRPADLNWAPRYSGVNATRCAGHPKVAAPAGVTPLAAELVRFSGAELTQGARGPAVSALQAGLGVGADGAFGPATLRALQDFQRRKGIPATGVSDAATWRALLAAGAVPTRPVPTTPATPAAPSVSGPGSGERRHTVVAGDTLSRIAAVHRVTVAALKTRNGLATDLIRVGQVLVVPGLQAAEAPAPAPGSAISRRVAAGGGEVAALGGAAGGEHSTPDGIGRFQHFRGGSLYWTPATGARTVRGGIRDVWARDGWETGVLGYPLTDELGTPDGVGRYNHFQGGSIYWTVRTGAKVVRGSIRDAWARDGWEAGVLGYPVTDELGTPDGVGRYNHFQGGSIYWTSRTGPQVVRGDIREAWARQGWERGPLGYPTRGEYDVSGGRAADFQGGRLVWSAATRQVRTELR